ncbi:MAG: HhH-GPD-type base excision DNA repair protein, partial [Candidatus Dormiibacterota bacterium]
MSPAISTSVPRLEWTEDPEADRLIAEDPLALLIGFCLDQQFPIEQAFLGPLRIRQRLGTLDAERLAATDPQAFVAAFRTPPAIHRFPASMAERVQGICRIVSDTYGGEASRLWREAGTAAELHRRLGALPGFGSLKAGIVTGVLARHFGVRPAGWEQIAPDFPTLADVTTAEERRAYQAAKRARKAALRAEGAAPPPSRGRQRSRT